MVVTLEAPKTSPTSLTLESETTLEAFILKQSRWLAVRASAPTHLHPAILVAKSVNSREASARLHNRDNAVDGDIISGATN
jgi:hypothetical protein